jgi:hypothetical protein
MKRSDLFACRRVAGIVATAVVAAAGTSASGIIVEGTELAQWVVPVTNQLALSHGAIFTSNNGHVTFGTNGVNTIGIYGTEPWAPAPAGYSWYGAPIEVTFVSMNDGVTPAVVNGTITAMFGDGGGDTDGIRMRAYDISNTLISTSFATTVSFGTVSLTGSGIYRVIFDQSGLGSPTSDTFLDWLDYPTPEAVPAPGALALLGGVLGMASCRRRRA